MHNNARSERQWRARDTAVLNDEEVLSLRAVDNEPGKKKPERHEVILQLLSSHAIASQEDLRRLLEERGWRVTQATLSRDLRQLGVVRALGG